MNIKKVSARLNRKGFSLTEMLLAMLILLMVTSVAAGGIPLAVRAYNQVVEASNAQVLLSTTIIRLRDELGKATDFEIVANTQISFHNIDGAMSVIRLKSDTDQDGPGIYLERYGYKDDGTEELKGTQLLVSKQAANENLYVKYDAITHDNAAVTFTGFSVMNEQGRNLASEPLTIRTMADMFS